MMTERRSVRLVTLAEEIEDAPTAADRQRCARQLTGEVARHDVELAYAACLIRGGFWCKRARQLRREIERMGPPAAT